MPIYVYEREDGTTFEKIQKVSDAPLETCPETGQKVERKLSPTAIHFKGSGFYQTDYKSNGKGSDSAESSGETGSSGESSSSSDSGSSEGKSSSGGCDGSGPSGGCPSCSSD